MDQTTSPKPVMDVMPPKPVTPDSASASHPTPTPTNADSSSALHQSETVAASQSGSDRSDATPMSPATVREPARSSETSATQRAESELAGGSTAQKPEMAVHAAPPLSDDDKADAAQSETAQTSSEKPKKPAAHAGAPKTHGPALAITAVVLAMIGLSALAILVYLNS